MFNGVVAARAMSYSPVVPGVRWNFLALPIVDCCVILVLLVWRVPLFLALLRISSLTGYKRSVFLMYICLVRPCV